MISQAQRYLGESLDILLDTQKLTRIEYIAIFEAEISIGDVLLVYPLG